MLRGSNEERILFYFCTLLLKSPEATGNFFLNNNSGTPSFEALFWREEDRPNE